MLRDPAAAEINTQSLKTTESGDLADYDASKKVKGRKLHSVVEVEGFSIKIAIHEASVQNQDGSSTVVLGVLEATPPVKKIWAEG